MAPTDISLVKFEMSVEMWGMHPANLVGLAFEAEIFELSNVFA